MDKRDDSLVNSGVDDTYRPEILLATNDVDGERVKHLVALPCLELRDTLAARWVCAP